MATQAHRHRTILSARSDCRRGVTSLRVSSSLLTARIQKAVRSALFHSLLLVVTMWAGAASANGVEVAIDPPARPAVETALLGASNDARSASSVPQLELDEGLARAARAHATEMAHLNYFSHISPDPASSTLAARLSQAGVPSVSAAENLALLEGVEDIAVAAVDGWLRSPGHRAALLNPGYTHVGFGVAEGATGQIYVAQVFARQPRNLVQASAIREAREGYTVSITVDLPRRLRVLPRAAGVSGEVQLLEPGLRSLSLHVPTGEVQQLTLAAALDDAGNFVIQDGGWVAPGVGTYQADSSMPRTSLRIAGVTSRPASGEVVRLELTYAAEGPALAVFVEGRHYRSAEVGPGRLRLYLPAEQPVELQVGEVDGSLVTPFHEFTLLPSVQGPRLVAGSSR